MITIDNIKFDKQADTDNYLSGYIDIPIKIFGQIRFNDKKKKLKLSIKKGCDWESRIQDLNEYIDWLGNCKQEIEDFYKKENQAILDNWYDGKLTPDFFETLEVYSGTITILENDTLCADFSCGDNVLIDHLLLIEFDDKEITEMWHDG